MCRGVGPLNHRVLEVAATSSPDAISKGREEDFIKKLIGQPGFTKIAEALRRKRKLEPAVKFEENDLTVYLADLRGLGETINLLGEMIDKGLLEPYPADYMVQCPLCGSIYVETKYQCPYCGSIKLEKTRIIQHVLCGYTDTEIHFREKRRGEIILVCPKCRKQLYREGEDYRVLGTIYECRDCNRRVAEPRIIHKCAVCGHTFTPKDALYKPIYGLRLTDRGLAFMNKDLVVIAVQSMLRNMGFTVKEGVELKGISGIPHKVDVYAESDDGLKIAVDIVRSRDEASALRAVVKRLDLDQDISYILVSGLEDKEILDALASSKIPIVPPESLEELKRTIEEAKNARRGRTSAMKQ